MEINGAKNNKGLISIPMKKKHANAELETK